MKTGSRLDEETVKGIIENWLVTRPNVVQILREQIIISEGLTTDLMGFNSEGEIVYIVECKGSVDISELAKGIGQAYQYVFQKSMNPRAVEAEVLLAVPTDINRHFDRLRIPEEIKVFLVSEDGSVYERVRRRIGAPAVELQLPRTFYIRDVELDHIRYLVLTIHDMSMGQRGRLNLTRIMERVRNERPEIAASGYNHFITLRSLGLINAENKLTPKGYHMLGLIERSQEAFQREMCESFYCFLINVLNAMFLMAIEKGQRLNEIECTHQEIADKICALWGQTVRFMYDPRTISTAMRILRELGSVTYLGRGRYKFNKLVHREFLPW